MPKPVELITTTVLHDIADTIERNSADDIAKVDFEALHGEIARKLLCNISHDAGLPAVVKALEAVGVCGGIDGIGRRLTSVRETRAAEGCNSAPRTPRERTVSADEVLGTVAKRLSEAFGPGVAVTPIKVSGTGEA